MTAPAIDVTLVAGHRAELLAVTLDSFQAGLFRHFEIGEVFANVDPIWGDAAEGDRCEALIRARFARAEVSRPGEPGFGRAVQRVWARTGDRPVFHMEDDWIALDAITPETILPHLTPDVGMVALAQHPRGRQDDDFAMRTRKIKLFGLTLGRRRVNGYGTSPRFLAAGLARRYAALLDPALDPEKQVYAGANPALGRLQEQFRCRTVWAPGGGALIEDIGRDWRDRRNIVKTYRKAAVAWTSAPDPPRGSRGPGT